MFVSTTADHASTRPNRRRAWWRWGFAPVVLLLLPFMLRAVAIRASVVDPDEGLYLLQAVTWLKGGWPYLAVWDMHPVGAPALLAPFVALLPSPVMALRIAGMVAVAATALLLMGLVMRLGASRAAGFAAGLLYATHTLVLGGLASNTEILFAPFMAAGATLLLGEALAERAPRPGIVLAAGLCFGMALWVKQVVGLEASALWLTMVGVALARRRVGVGAVLVLALVFALGSALPTALTAAIYAAKGEFATWWNSNVTVLLDYAAVEDGAPGFRRGVVVALGGLMWLLGTAMLILVYPPARRRAALLLPWLGAAIVQAAAPGKFFDHYFLMLLPPLCALAALGIEAVAIRSARRGLRSGAVIALAAAIAAMPVSDTLLPRLAHGFGWRLPDPATQVAAIARAEVRPGEALYVANWHPVVYALAGMEAPTRFAFPSHLAGLHAGLTGFDQDAELDRVLSLPPRIIVIAPSHWWRTRPEARARIEAALVSYDRIATIADGDGPVEVWRRR